MFKSVLILLCVLSIVKEYYCFDREIHCDLNPGCEDCNNVNITLFYVQAIGEKDVIHNLWDFTLGKPAILFAVTDLNTTFNVGWENTSLSSITFSKRPKYSFGLIINKVWEFNDVNDTESIDPADKTAKEFDLQNVTWHRYSLAAKEDEASVYVKSHTFGNDNRNGTIDIKLNLYPYISYGFELPHLIHSANSSLVDIVLENMTTSFNKSRFALELLLISTESKNDSSIDINIRKGLDDEHTPGIFEIIELITPETETNGDGGFVQFHPVSYTAQLRDVSTSTPVHMSNMMKGNITNTIGQIFFNDYTFLLVEKLNISFGGKGDGYYNRSKYNIWSFTVGYGLPPLEGFSLFVILIISIGLGVPVFLMLVGGLYVCCKRRNRSNQPEILIEG